MSDAEVALTPEGNDLRPPRRRAGELLLVGLCAVVLGNLVAGVSPWAMMHGGRFVRDSARHAVSSFVAPGATETQPPAALPAVLALWGVGYLACFALGAVCLVAARHRVASVAVLLLVLCGFVALLGRDLGGLAWGALAVLFAIAVGGDLLLLAGSGDRFACAVVGLVLAGQPAVDLRDSMELLEQLSQGRLPVWFLGVSGVGLGIVSLAAALALFHHSGVLSAGDQVTR